MTILLVGVIRSHFKIKNIHIHPKTPVSFRELMLLASEHADANLQCDIAVQTTYSWRHRVRTSFDASESSQDMCIWINTDVLVRRRVSPWDCVHLILATDPCHAVMMNTCRRFC